MNSEILALLTLDEVRAILKCSRRTLDRLHQTGDLRKKKRGKRTVVYSRADVMAYLERIIR